jgi:hypothetical protein
LKKQLRIDSEVFVKLSQLPKDRRDQCWMALLELTETFGRPHIHSGLAIRKFGAGLFECRGNLDLRFVFADREHDLNVFFLGNHDEVRTGLRDGRFYKNLK